MGKEGGPWLGLGFSGVVVPFLRQGRCFSTRRPVRLHTHLAASNGHIRGSRAGLADVIVGLGWVVFLACDAVHEVWAVSGDGLTKESGGRSSGPGIRVAPIRGFSAQTRLEV